MRVSWQTCASLHHQKIRSNWLRRCLYLSFLVSLTLFCPLWSRLYSTPFISSSAWNCDKDNGLGRLGNAKHGCGQEAVNAVLQLALAGVRNTPGSSPQWMLRNKTHLQCAETTSLFLLSFNPSKTAPAPRGPRPMAVHRATQIKVQILMITAFTTSSFPTSHYNQCSTTTSRHLHRLESKALLPEVLFRRNLKKRTNTSLKTTIDSAPLPQTRHSADSRGTPNTNMSSTTSSVSRTQP